MDKRLVSLLIVMHLIGAVIGKSRSDLVKDLYEGYDTRVRPSKHYKEKVAVEFKLSLTELLDVVSTLHSFKIKKLVNAETNYFFIYGVEILATSAYSFAFLSRSFTSERRISRFLYHAVWPKHVLLVQLCFSVVTLSSLAVLH